MTCPRPVSLSVASLQVSHTVCCVANCLDACGNFFPLKTADVNVMIRMKRKEILHCESPKTLCGKLPAVEELCGWWFIDMPGTWLMFILNFSFSFLLWDLGIFSSAGPRKIFFSFSLAHAFWAFATASPYVTFLETSNSACLYITHLLEAVTLWGWRQFWCCRGRGGWNRLAALWSSPIMPLELWTQQTAAWARLMVQENNVLVLVDSIIFI